MLKVDVAKLPSRRTGRPRRITLDAIIDAALDLGLDRFEMTAVAEQLGVGIATLYGYVQNRAQLVQLAAARCARRSGIVDVGQTWQDLLREHAAMSFEKFTTWPELVGQTMQGSVGDHAQITPLDGLLALLLDRGIEPVDAFNLVYEVTQIVIGAAVGFAYLKSIEQKSVTYHRLLGSVLDSHDPNQLTAVRKCFRATGQPAVIGAYHATLERVLADHESRLGLAGT